jgi:manganese-dependent inorganic pyrophosphatase
MTTFIIGHIKPDLDATVAAIALEHLYRAAPDLGYKNPQAVIADAINNETRFVLEKFGIEIPGLFNEEELAESDSIILVDHNEDSQRHSGINSDQIVEVIDHHKLNINLEKPLYLTSKPWGSSSTVVWWLMQKHGVKPDQKIAALMLCAILSDTIGFKSSTTTDYDKTIAQELATIAQITNLDELTLEIFKAKSNISDLTAEEIVTNDYKIFDFNGKKVLIDQLETVEQDKVLAQKVDLQKAMASVKTREEVDYVIVAISDILQVNTKVIGSSPEEVQLIERAFAGQATDDVLDIGPKLSRKKDIAPAIERALNAS